MEFLYPNILYGLFAVAIPILVHLFNFRKYQKVYFSNVALLKSIHKKTKKQSQLKHLLVLLMRILAIVFVVLAFARPFIPKENSVSEKQEHQMVSLYLDNSFSMTHMGENGSLLNEAQNMALNILESYENSDKFHLITNEMDARHHRWFNKMEMAQHIMEVEPVYVQQELEEVFQREQMLRNQDDLLSNKAYFYLLSDFQKNASFNKNMEVDTNLLVRLLPLPNNPVNNLSVDSVWFEYPVQLPQTVSVLHVQLSNNGEEDQNSIPLKLFIQSQQKAVLTVDLEAGDSRVFDLSFTNEGQGHFTGRIEIEDYPITYDDRLFFGFQVRDLFQVAVISNEKSNAYLNQLFEEDTLVQLTNFTANSVDYNLLTQQDLIVVNGIGEMGSGLAKELEDDVKAGTQVLFIPSEDHQYKSWLRKNNLPIYQAFDSVAVRLNEINKELNFFERVFQKEWAQSDKNQKIDLPMIYQYWPINLQSASTALSLLQTRSGKTLLSESKLGKGKVYQLAFPLRTSYSQLPQHALFVPVVYQMVMQSKDQKPMYEILGSGDPVQVSIINENRAKDAVVYLKQGEQVWIPEIMHKNHQEYTLLHVQWPNDGVFEVQFQGITKEEIAVNYNRKESDFRIWSPEELSHKIAQNNWPNFQMIKSSADQITAQLIQLDQGFSLWKWFLFFAIIFIFVETMILRFWK